MPVSMMRNGLTAENSIFSQRPNISVSRSRFDLSRLNVFTSDIGMIVPVDLIPTIPGDEFDLSCIFKVDFRPMLVPTLTPYKVKIHYYYCPNEYLWSGWESFISKGRSGSLALQVPQINLINVSKGPYTNTSTDPNFFPGTSGGDSPSYGITTPCSLASYLLGNPTFDNKSEHGYLPFEPAENTGALDGLETGYNMMPVSALPFLMYQKIYRSNYLDPNLMSNGIVESPVWFPDDIDSSHWRINYSGENLFDFNKRYFVPDNVPEPSVANLIANFVPIPSVVGQKDGDNCVDLLQLRYATYNSDMFTTALPFLQRGPETSLDLESTVDRLFVEFTEPEAMSSVGGSYTIPANSIYSEFADTSLPSLVSTIQLYGDNSSFRADSNKFSGVSTSPQASPFGGAYTRGYVDLSGANLGISFTARQLRDLLAVSVWQERNALTNGSYGQFVKVHFDRYPNNQFCEPIYIGGTTSVFDVNSILQTSASGINGSTTPLGEPAGVGGSFGRDTLGHFRADDFGFIMALMMIVPDNVYPNSWEHWAFDKNPDDFYMPEYERLSYQPILNKQLFYSGDDSTDNGLFGYSNRYVYMKQRDSIARGRMALPSSVDSYYSSYVQKREFTDTPQLNMSFVTVYPPNIDRSFLAYPGQPAFIVQYYSGVKAVRPMSYVSQPNTFGF